MDVTINECRALDVHNEDGQRLGYVIETSDKKQPWVAIAILPANAKDMILGTFKRPKQAVRALIENEDDQWTIGKVRT